MSRSNKDSNLHKNHRNRVKEKFLHSGFDTFSEHEILEMLLFYTIPLADTNELAHRLIKKYHNLAGVLDANIDSLVEVDGVGNHTAIFLKMLPAAFCEYSKRKLDKNTNLNTCSQAKEYVAKLTSSLDHEQFFIICLNSSNRIISTKKISTGSFNKVEVPIRKVTDFVFKNNCDRIILAHNHPNGKPNPSPEDIVLTHKLFYSCVLNDIDILDHIIYSPLGSYSFSENQEMDAIKRDVLHSLKLKPQSIIYQKFCSSKENYIID